MEAGGQAPAFAEVTRGSKGSPSLFPELRCVLPSYQHLRFPALIYKERRLLLKMSTNVIRIRCFKDKHNTKLLSSYNNIDTGKLPLEFKDLTITEQQLVSRLSLH